MSFADAPNHHEEQTPQEDAGNPAETASKLCVAIPAPAPGAVDGDGEPAAAASNSTTASPTPTPSTEGMDGVLGLDGLGHAAGRFGAGIIVDVGGDVDLDVDVNAVPSRSSPGPIGETLLEESFSFSVDGGVGGYGGGAGAGASASAAESTAWELSSSSMEDSALSPLRWVRVRQHVVYCIAAGVFAYVPGTYGSTYLDSSIGTIFLPEHRLLLR